MYIKTLNSKRLLNPSGFQRRLEGAGGGLERYASSGFGAEAFMR